MSEVINHKCPCCGATLEFDIGSQMVKCPYCDSEFDPKSLSENEGDLSVDLATDGGVEWEEAELYGISEYQCQSCGGDIYSDQSTSATICPYCGNAVMLKGRLSGVLKPDKVIPFQKTKNEALLGLHEHCRKKRFVPKNFINENKLEEVKGLYVPFWVYDAELDADIEYDCMEEHTWTSGNTEYTERKYYTARRAGDIAFDHVPADGSSKMPDELMESIEPFDYDKAEDFTTSYLSGYVADRYDVDQEQVRPRIRKRMAEGAADAFKRTVTGYDSVTVSDSQITAKSSTVNYVLYPVWLINTDWDGRKFTFAMNGQTGKMVGNLPADNVKLSIVTIAVFAVISLLFGTLIGSMDEELNIGAILVGVILGAIAAAAVFFYFKNQLKSVAFEHGAANYYRQDSMVLRVKTDTFIRKEVTTRRIKDD